MSPIIPAIIPESLQHLRSTFARVEPFAHEVQVDIVDGVFVPFLSWPHLTNAPVHDLTEFTEDFLVEVDLMIEAPECVIEEYAKANVRRIVVHLEGVHDLERIMDVRERYDFKLGFSIDNNTPLSVLTDVLDKAEYVQLMGIAHIGSQGQPFDERVIGRIKELKEKYPHLLISIDGSVNVGTVGKLAHAGAGRLVSGSAILKAPNPQEAFTHLESLFSISV